MNFSRTTSFGLIVYRHCVFLYALSSGTMAIHLIVLIHCISPAHIPTHFLFHFEFSQASSCNFIRFLSINYQLCTGSLWRLCWPLPATYPYVTSLHSGWICRRWTGPGFIALAKHISVLNSTHCLVLMNSVNSSQKTPRPPSIQRAHYLGSRS